MRRRTGFAPRGRSSDSQMWRSPPGERTLALLFVVAAVAIATAGSFAGGAAATSGFLVLTKSTTLAEDHQGSIIVAADGITIDCAGHSVTGPGFAGFDIRNVRGTTIKNCNVSGFKVGFFLWSAPNNKLTNNTSRSNEGEGFALASSPNNNGNELKGNTAEKNGWWGFAVYDDTQDTRLAGNTASANGFAGFFVGLGSNRTRLTANVARANNTGFDIDSDANIVTGNTAEDNQSNGFLVFQANNNVFTGNTAQRNQWSGFVITGAETNNTFLANRATKNGSIGFVFADGASSNRLRANRSVGNLDHGFVFSSVSGIDSMHDQATGNGGDGFALDNATDSTFVHDTANNGTRHGFSVGGSKGNLFRKDVANQNANFGFVLFNDSKGNTIDESTAHGNPWADAADYNVAANSWLNNSFGLTFFP